MQASGVRLVPSDPLMKALKKLYACVTIFAISSSALLRGATDAPPAGVAGRYAMPGQNETYLDLRPDGTCTMSIGGIKDSSTYTVKGSVLTLITPRGPADLPIANGALTGPDGSKWPRTGEPAPAPPSKPSSEASIRPGAGTSGNPAGAGAPPPEGVTITLKPQIADRGRRYGASFPAAQLPANPQGYFWVVDRPDNETKVAELHRNEWHVSTQPGIYKIRVEYRSGGVNKTVSNVLEVTVPGAAAPAR